MTVPQAVPARVIRRGLGVLWEAVKQQIRVRIEATDPGGRSAEAAGPRRVLLRLQDEYPRALAKDKAVALQVDRDPRLGFEVGQAGERLRSALEQSFEVGGIRRGVAPGWHRSFCIELNHWRGSPDCPGLMLALGILDPESTTQNYDTLYSKMQAGQVLFSFWPWRRCSGCWSAWRVGSIPLSTSPAISPRRS